MEKIGKPGKWSWNSFKIGEKEQLKRSIIFNLKE